MHVTVTPVVDVPTLSLGPVAGHQDTAIPLAIDAQLADTDGSESLVLDITGLPFRARLSAGVVVALGHYRVAGQHIADLAVIPTPGSTDSFQLNVTATATETATGQSASVDGAIDAHVYVTMVEPITLDAFVVNRGQDQRSLLHTLQVTFNQDVWISDMASDFKVHTLAAEPLAIPADRYAYDPRTFTLSIDTDALLTRDAQYVLSINPLGVSAVGNRNLTLSLGPGWAEQRWPCLSTVCWPTSTGMTTSIARTWSGSCPTTADKPPTPTSTGPLIWTPAARWIASTTRSGPRRGTRPMSTHPRSSPRSCRPTPCRCCRPMPCAAMRSSPDWWPIPAA